MLLLIQFLKVIFEGQSHSNESQLDVKCHLHLRIIIVMLSLCNQNSVTPRGLSNNHNISQCNVL